MCTLSENGRKEKRTRFDMQSVAESSDEYAQIKTLGPVLKGRVANSGYASPWKASKIKVFILREHGAHVS